MEAPALGRATVVYGSPAKLALSGEESGVVTRTFLSKGASVESGATAIEVVGHPVVVLQAPFSPYRDIAVGSQGPDVKVLKDALAALGYGVSVGATMSAGDMAGVSTFFRDRGYTLPTAASNAGGAAPDKAAAKTSTVPRTWWVGMPRLPSRVVAPGPQAGSTATSSAISLTSGAPQLKVTMADAGRRITPGENLTFTPDGKAPLSLTVASSAAAGRDGATTGDEGSSGENATDTGQLVTTEEPLDPAIVDAVGKLTVGAADPVQSLAVPLTAIRSGASGRPEVVRRDAGRDQRLTVTLGRQGGDWVEVTASSPALKAGETVVLH